MEIEEDYQSKLEVEFERYRVFKDYKDFTEFKPKHERTNEPLCLVYKISPQLKPDLQIDLDNAMWVCGCCIIDRIDAFKKYRIKNNIPEQNDEEEVINVFTRI